jgi:membrane dipeptidase
MSLVLVNASADTPSRKEQAQKIAQQYLVADTHIDVPYRLEEGWVDVTKATDGGDFDYPSQ